MPKHAARSKTIQFNGIAGLLVTILWPFLPDHWKTDPEIFQAILGLICLTNMVLRVLTKDSVRLRSIASLDDHNEE